MNNFYLKLIKQQGKDQELLYVVEEYFNKPHQYRFDASGDISAFVYSNANSNPILEVILTKKGRVAQITSHLSDQETKALEKQIKHTILDDNGIKIGQTICFTSATVETYYRCDHFQILPIPMHAPKSKTLDGTPFLLQFIYPTSLNWRIDGMRRMEREQRYLNLLTLFLHTPIVANPGESSLIWTRDTELHTEQRFLGYFYEGYTPSIDNFSDTNSYQRNIAIPAIDYYTGILAFRNVFIVGQDELRIPDNLCDSFEKVLNLSKIERENFYLACHWLRLAQTHLSNSKSISLIALITAIECLIDKKRCLSCNQERVVATGRCEVCGEPIYKITEAFKEFAESLLPDVTHNQKALSLLYDTRSSLVHGSEILLSDAQPWVGFTENKRAFDEYGIYDRAYVLTKVMLYNWLHNRK